MKDSLINLIGLLVGALWLGFCALLLLGYISGESASWLRGAKLGDVEWLRAAGFFIAGIGVAPLGLWLAHRRTASLSSQTENDAARRITDAFTQAVELLGNDSTAVRQGGIYALGRLANKDRHEHPKIIDIVAAYIREKSPKAPEPTGDGTGHEDAQISSAIDVEAAIAVIRDRRIGFDKKKRGKNRFDLSNCKLLNADLVEANLADVNLSDCFFRGCLFQGANLRGANMVWSKFPDSEFAGSVETNSKIKDADFTKADLRGADLSGVKENALTQAQLDSANGDETTKIPSYLERPEHWCQ